MVAQEFMTYLSQFNVVSSAGIDDFADRFNYVYTVIVLALCVGITTMKQYFMDPINCYQAQFATGTGFSAYVDHFCWMEGTYNISLKDRFPKGSEQWDKVEDRKITYYQWVPFVLALQLILFYIPRVLWQLLSYQKTGTDVEFLVNVAHEASQSPSEDRKDKITHVAKILEEMVLKHRDFRRGRGVTLQRRLSCLFCGKRMGNILCFTYFCIKLLYLGNIIMQIFIMQLFLGFKGMYQPFGYQVLRDIASGDGWETTMIFPRVTFCLVPVRHVGRLNHFTAQCALPVNMLNEKIYIFLWFWMVAGATFTSISILTWLFRMVIPRKQTKFIRHYLRITKDFRKDQSHLVKQFIEQFLRKDGIFLLKIMSMNVGDLVVSEVITTLWHIFKDNYQTRNLGKDAYNDLCDEFDEERKENLGDRSPNNVGFPEEDSKFS